MPLFSTKLFNQTIGSAAFREQGDMAAVFQSGKAAGGEEAFSLVNLHRESQTTEKKERTKNPGPRAPVVISHIHLLLLSYSLSLTKRYDAFWRARDLMTAGKSISLLLPDRKALCPEQKIPSQAAKLRDPAFPSHPSCHKAVISTHLH